jgi:hypothetical protein
MNEPDDTSSIPTTIEALLQLQDKEFVDAAYAAMLGRTPDPGGLKNYVEQLRAGIRREHLIVDIALSPEGQQNKIPFSGLDSHIERYRQRPRSKLAPWFGRSRLEAAEAADRALRIIDNKLYRIDKELRAQSTLLAQLAAQLAALSSAHATPAADPAALPNTNPGSAFFPNQLPVNLAEILSQLTAAVELKRPS